MRRGLELVVERLQGKLTRIEGNRRARRQHFRRLVLGAAQGRVGLLLCEGLIRGLCKDVCCQRSSRVNERTVRRFVMIKEWLANEGFFHPMNWGANRKAPYFLDDEAISSKASRWLRINTGFKKGMGNLLIGRHFKPRGQLIKNLESQKGMHTLIISDSAHLLISPFVLFARWE